jgi:hypothetical protein
MKANFWCDEISSQLVDPRFKVDVRVTQSLNGKAALVAVLPTPTVGRLEIRLLGELLWDGDPEEGINPLRRYNRQELMEELQRRSELEDCVDCGHDVEEHDDPEYGCAHVDEDGDRCACMQFVGYDSVAKEDRRNEELDP